MTLDKDLSDTILRAENLKRHYSIAGRFLSPDKTIKALDGISFDLQPGKTLAVVGESGCGKSTLARLVTMIESPTAGRLWIRGRDVAAPQTKDDRRLLRRSVQIVFQDPYGSLNPRRKISHTLEEPLKINTTLGATERRKSVLEMLERVGLRSDQADRYPHMFSGGQRQRIAIARALMLKPDIVVLDEPVSALDVSIQAQILNLLRTLQEEMTLAYLFISHDLSVVRHIADDVMVMYLGRPVETGRIETLFRNPQHPYTRALLSATPIADPSRKRTPIKLSGELPSPLAPPPGCAFHTRCPLVQPKCHQTAPRLRPNGNSHPVACHVVEAGGVEESLFRP